MTPGIDVDGCGSPHLFHLQQVVDIVDEVEANHKGQTDQKFLCAKEKYKIGLLYMEMLEDPKKFKFLENKSGEKEEKLQMNLPDKDIWRWEQLQQKISEINAKKEKFSQMRAELLKKQRSISVQPKIISKLAPESVRN